MEMDLRYDRSRNLFSSGYLPHGVVGIHSGVSELGLLGALSRRDARFSVIAAGSAAERSFQGHLRGRLDQPSQQSREQSGELGALI